MEVVLNGIYNFLSFVESNWTMITACFGLAVLIGKKIKDYLEKSEEEKIKIAKTQIKEVMLMLVTQAETDYYTWVSAGAVKRSQVIDEVFAMYPILSKVTNQEEIIAFIDETIDEALKEMRKIFEENEPPTLEEVKEGLLNKLSKFKKSKENKNKESAKK